MTYMYCVFSARARRRDMPARRRETMLWALATWHQGMWALAMWALAMSHLATWHQGTLALVRLA